MVLGKLIHYSVDLVLVSTALAGIRRSTGYKLNTENLVENKDVRGYLDKYLAIGERTIDLVVWQMGTQPGYFKKDK